MIRILLWNALVRSTMTYALQTQNLERDINHREMDSFAHKCIRQMHNKDRYKTQTWISRDTLYGKYAQPTIYSWLLKLATTHYLRQTTYTNKIHTHEHRNIQHIHTMWIATWGQHRKYNQTKQEQQATSPTSTDAHLYMIQTSKKRDNFILIIFHKWKTHPNTDDVTEEESYRNGNMHRAARTTRNPEQEPDKDTYPCPTCRQEYLTYKSLSRHRANKEQCERRWETEKPQRRELPI